MFVLDNFKKHGFSQLADGGTRKLSPFWTSKKWLVGKLYHYTSHLNPLYIPCVSIYIPLRYHLHTICISIYMWIYIYICIYKYIYISSISGKEHWYIFTFDQTTHPFFSCDFRASKIRKRHRCRPQKTHLQCGAVVPPQLYAGFCWFIYNPINIH